MQDLLFSVRVALLAKCSGSLTPEFRHSCVYACMCIFFPLVVPTVPNGPSPPDGLIPFTAIPRRSPPIRYSSRYNACPNTVPASTSSPSFCPYILRLTVSKMFSTFLVPSIRLMWPNQFSLVTGVSVAVSMSRYRVCSLQSAVCILQSAVCSLQSAICSSSDSCCIQLRSSPNRP